MAHDVLPEQCPLYPKFVEAGHLWADQVTFFPYWKDGPITTATADGLVSAHLADGRARLWVVNKGRRDAAVKVAVNWRAAGLNRAALVASNAVTGAPVVLEPDGFTVPVEQRDFVPVLLKAAVDSLGQH